jgi:2,5-diamino-6-(ribosylamino)-4(3H)-pyrimidinone 5'-phosphate reductase
MTHYLRSRHDAILIGVSTAIADDPSLNCRIEGVGGYGGQGLVGQPRPIILDGNARWAFSADSKVLALAAEGKGKAPFVICSRQPSEGKGAILQRVGGKFIILDGSTDSTGKLGWVDILKTLRNEGIRSVMVEGGGAVINDLLRPQHASLVHSVIVTIAPTWLGQGGVVVSPPRRFASNGSPGAPGAPIAAARLKEVKWYPFGEDVVLCGKLQLE